MLTPLQAQDARKFSVIPTGKPSPLTLALQAFTLSREAMGCTASTLKYYRVYLPPLLAFLKKRGVHDANLVTADHLRGWLVDRQAAGLAAQTVWHYASAARAFFHFLLEDGLLQQNPMARVKMPKLPQEILPAFSGEDATHLLGVAQTERDKALVLCLLSSGLRAAEMLALNVGSVDMKTGAVSVRHGKGRKDRTAFLGAKARRVLLKYLMQRGDPGPGDPLWLAERTGSRLTYEGLRAALARLGKRAGVAHSTPHTFRRSFAIWSWRGGNDLISIQRLMGHSNLAVIHKYLKQSNEDLQEAHRKSDPVDRMMKGGGKTPPLPRKVSQIGM